MVMRTWGRSSAITVALVVIALSSFATGVKAQDIRIKVINGRNGRIISDECVTVWVGKNTVFSLLIPTDKNGVALLHLTDDDAKVSVQTSKSACGGYGVIDPVLKYADTVAITSGGYMPCQAHPANSPKLSFSTREILERGDATANACGKIEPSPEPGVLIFFERPLTFWDKWKR
jgi:hypothetical protein